jgi:hypothetical protein
MNERQPERWEVRRGNFVQTKRQPDGSLKDIGNITVSCGHRKVGACGGCYARLYLAFELIRTTPEAVKQITEEVHGALEAEGAARRLQGKG